MRERTSPTSSSQVSLPTSPGPPSPAPRYSHPYGYHSTASSVLTRTASSPSQPISHASYSPRPATPMSAAAMNRDDSSAPAHKRGARSMSSLKGSVSVGDLSLRASAPAEELKEEDNTIKPRGGSGGPARHSVGGATPYTRPSHSSARSVDDLFGAQHTSSQENRSGSGPWRGGRVRADDWQSRNTAQKTAGAKARTASNPKGWGSQELADYLLQALQDKDNDNDNDKEDSAWEGVSDRLSPEAARAATDWILTNGIDGKQFLTMQVDFGTLKPPEGAAPALHSISRHLRRVSLGAGRSSTGGNIANSRSIRQEGSVLMEQDESEGAASDYFSHASHRPRTSSISSVSSSSSRTSVSERIALFEGSNNDTRRVPVEAMRTPSRSKAGVSVELLSNDSGMATSATTSQADMASSAAHRPQPSETGRADNGNRASLPSEASTTPLETPSLPTGLSNDPIVFPTILKAVENDSTPRKANDARQPEPDLLKVEGVSQHMVQHVKSGSRPYGALKRNHSSGSAAGGGPRFPTVGLLRKSQDSAVFVPDTPLTPKALAELADTLAADPDDRDTSRRVTIRPQPKVTEIFPTQQSPSSPEHRANVGQLEARLHEYQSEHLALLQRLNDAEARVHALEEELLRRQSREPMLQRVSARVRDLLWQTATQPVPPYAWAAIGGVTAFVIMSLSRRIANVASRQAA